MSYYARVSVAGVVENRPADSGATLHIAGHDTKISKYTTWYRWTEENGVELYDGFWIEFSIGGLQEERPADPYEQGMYDPGGVKKNVYTYSVWRVAYLPNDFVVPPELDRPTFHADWDEANDGAISPWFGADRST